MLVFSSESEIRSDRSELRLVEPVTWECEKCYSLDKREERGQSINMYAPSAMTLKGLPIPP